MSTTDLPDDDTLETLSEEGYTSRKPTGALKYLYYAIGLGMAAFHIWFLGYSSMEPWALYYSHICFGVVLAYFLYPFSRRSNKRMPTLGDWACMLLAASACIYFILELDTIIYRVGVAPTSLDLFFSTVIVVLILEMTRRTNGWILPAIAIFFLAYALLGKYLPYSLGGHRGYSFARVFSYITGMDGMLSTPLATSASFVFLFFLFSAFLASTGAGQFFIDIAMDVAGGKRGGPAKVAVISSALCGMVSGSSVGNTVTTGSVTIPMMKKTGYKPEFAGAVEAAASTGGQIMPPIMGAAAFLMAEYVGISYGEIALKAILPAFLYFAGIFIAVHLEAKKLGLKGIPRSEMVPGKELAVKSYLLIPIVLLVVLVSLNVYTMQKAAALSIIAAIVVGVINKDSRLTPAKFLEALEAGGKGTITVAVACAMAGIIAGCITVTGLASKLITAIVALSGNTLIIGLFLTMICCIILGMGVPTTANYCIMAATCAPILMKLGVPTVAAHFFVFYFGIVADITPPVALAAYAGSAIAKSNPMKTGVNATKLAIAAFIVPYVFAYSPSMLFVDVESWVDIVTICLSAMLGIYGVAAGLNGFVKRKLNWLFRILFIVGGLTLIIPGWKTDAIGLILVGGLTAYEFIMAKKEQNEAMA